MLRLLEDLPHLAGLRNLPCVHDRCAISDVRDDPKVVRDEQHRKPELVAKAHQKVQDWPCTVTSSAVVGSSAITSAGSQASAIAIITRCAIPPENS